MPPLNARPNSSKGFFRLPNFHLSHVCCLSIRTCAKVISWWNLIASVATLMHYLWKRVSSDHHAQSPAVVIFGVLFFAILLLGVHSDNYNVLYHVFIFFTVNIIQVMLLTTIMLLLGEVSFPIPEGIENRNTLVILSYAFFLALNGFDVLIYYNLYLDSCPQQLP